MKLFSLLFLIISSAYAVEAPVVRTMNDKNLKWGPCPEIFPKGCEMTVIHGNPAQAHADVYMKVPSNYTIPAHSHTSPEHMTLVSGEMKVKYQGSQEVMMKNGTYAYGPAGVPHEAKCVSAEACVLSVGFEKPVDAKAYKGNL